MLMSPGSSLGGARPKASVVDENNQLWIAKFPSRHDDHDRSPEGHGPNGVQTPFIVEDSDIVGGYGGKQGDPPHDDGDNDVEAYVVTYILQKKCSAFFVIRGCAAAIT